MSVSLLPSTLTAGQSATFTLSSLDFSSRPTQDGDDAGTDEKTSSVTAKLDGTEVGTSAAANGTASLTVAVPAGATKGAGTLVLTTDTGTTVTIPVPVGQGLAGRVGRSPDRRLTREVATSPIPATMSSQSGTGTKKRNLGEAWGQASGSGRPRS
ncbi:MAG: hypothetical protein ACRYG2_19640 [Janthinobacterium lividum]